MTITKSYIKKKAMCEIVAGFQQWYIKKVNKRERKYKIREGGL